jgi:hypothetical protein
MTNNCFVCLQPTGSCQDYCLKCWPRVKAKRQQMAETYREQMAKRLANYPEIARLARKYA